MLAVDRNWKATVLHLENVSASSRDHAAIAKGLLQILKSARFITFLGFMLDFIAVLSKLSCSFQSDSLLLAEVLDEISIFSESTSSRVGTTTAKIQTGVQ